MSSKNKNWPPSPVEWLVIATIAAVLVALLLPSSQHATTGKRRHMCRSNLKAIGLALYNYHDKYGCFPPAYLTDKQGRPSHSWRVLLLPFMDHAAACKQYRFDEPWDSPHNRTLAEKLKDLFRCPSTAKATTTDHDQFTNYVAIVGHHTCWTGSQSVKLTDITDPLQSTLLIVEVTDSQIHWMEPRDLQFSELDLTINNRSHLGISSPHTKGAHGLFADGHVSFLAETLTKQTLRSHLTRAGGEPTPEH